MQLLRSPYATAPAGAESAKSLYFALLTPSALPQEALDRSRSFLESKLEETQDLPCDLPQRIEDLESWMENSAAKAGRQYREYLAARRAGQRRRYFGNKSHALNFLSAVAPTKLVDGSWLYGVLQRWDDPRFTHLVRTYLEELGDGLPDKNHVVLYRKLLAAHGCEDYARLGDNYFTQGAIQLCLAYHAAEFLPEVIGFNLGYEQLPLHLLITAYELNELGIDPYYFTLHVTVDNAASGHARKAVQAVIDALPQSGEREDFFRRMVNGYKLNELGIGTLDAIASFDLEQSLLDALSVKAVSGAALHSDYCRVGGRAVSDWLSEPARMPEFLSALEQAGWIRRNEDPELSRFWKLINGEQAEMFGVFTPYEQQLLHDWIAGDAGSRQVSRIGAARQPSFRARRRLDEARQDQGATRGAAHPMRGVFRCHSRQRNAANDADDFSADLRRLEEELAALGDHRKIMARLVELLAPAAHHTPAGLMATRIFNRMLQ